MKDRYGFRNDLLRSWLVAVTGHACVLIENYEIYYNTKSSN